MPNPNFLFFAAAVIVAAWFLTRPREAEALKRLQRYMSKETGGDRSKAGRFSIYHKLDTKMERVPAFKKLFNAIEQNLIMANLPIKTSEFLIGVMILSVTLLIVQIIMTGGYHPMSPLVVPGGMLLSFVLLKMYIQLRIGRIRGQLKLAISMLANNLKAGHSFIQGLRQVTSDLNQPLKSEFELLLNENQLGIPLDVALNNMQKRAPCKELQTLVRGVILQQQTGSNLVFILNTIYQNLQDRDDLRNKISVLTIQGKLSGLICVAIPFLLLWFMSATQPDYTDVLFNTPLGQTLLKLCGFMIFLGSFFIMKIVSFKF